MDTDISILLPTRGRVAQMRRFLDSLAATAESPERIEIVLYLDHDDPDSQAIADKRLRIVKLLGERRPLGVMTNVCYAASSGRYVLLCGDDSVFRTRHWDHAVKKMFARFPYGIALIFGDDLIQGPNLATTPFLSRTCCRLLGGPCPPIYQNEYIDTHIFDLFLKLGELGHHRLIYLPNVVIEHMHHVVGKAELDATYLSKMPCEQSHALFAALEPLRAKQARILERHIREAAPPAAALGPVRPETAQGLRL